MNNEDKSKLKELWAAAGLEEPQPGSLNDEPPAASPASAGADTPPEPQKSEKTTKKKPEKKAKHKNSADPKQPESEQPTAEQPEDAKKPDAAKKSETAEKAPDPNAPEGTEQSPHTEKKKDIKFLVIYTVVFLIVISGLIAGSYLITSRIHKQMAQSNEDLNTSQSTLTNIQNENAKLREENALLKEENANLLAADEDANALLGAAGDLQENDGLLIAAQSAYISGNRSQATELMRAIDREKLSEPNKEYYDLLADRLE